MSLSKVLISVVLSLLFLPLFFAICQAGELDEADKFKRVILTEDRGNPFLTERWGRETLDQQQFKSFLRDSKEVVVEEKMQKKRG